jgi:alginate export protein
VVSLNFSRALWATTVFIILSAFFGISSVLSQEKSSAGSEVDGPDRPKFNFLRFQEDWSALREIPPSQRSDPFDSIKYIPLTADGSLWLSLGGRMRFRLENWSNFAFAAPNDDTFLLTRIFLHGDLHLGENLRVFVEGKSAHSTDRNLPGGRRTQDVDVLELQQAFIDLRIPLGADAAFTLRPGRREFLKGKQRLVSPLPWGNTVRQWDGVSGILDIPNWNIESFWTQFAPVQKYKFNTPDSSNLFFGVYGAGKIMEGQVDLDLYWLGIDRDAQTFNGTLGEEERHTLGGRLSGKMAPFDYEVEGAYQFGTIGAGDISAFMVASQFGYARADWQGRPRFYLGFDYASGDDAPGGDVGTFNQLFPLGHAYLGFMDFIGRQNNIDFSHGVAVHPVQKMTVAVTGHQFWRAEVNDALYNAGGGVLRAGAPGSSRDVGYEVDLTTRYQFNRHLKGLVGYSHFFSGTFIKESGPAKDVDFVYVQGIFTF